LVFGVGVASRSVPANFTDFSDDLTDLKYNHKGVFVNLIGTM